MRIFVTAAGVGLLTLASLATPCASAQGPVPAVVPVIVDTAAPIVVNAVKPKPPPGTVKFEGFVLNANIAQITVRSKADERSIQTFTLTQEVSAKMQQIVDKGGYQWGDKVTIYYDPSNMIAKKIKGKPSKVS
jgi:hypothetical protein